MEDVCKKPAKLEGCCCAAAVEALWHLQLPVNIRAHVSNMEFDHSTYKSVFEAADKVFLSAKQVSVAALRVASQPQQAQLDETVSAFNPENQPQVAAIGGGKKNKPPRKNKKNQSGGGGSDRGQKHSSVPDNKADQMCDRHYRHGGDAWYCLAPSSCPWKDRCKPRA